MDRFISFENDINLEDLQSTLLQNNPGIMILRLSKLTGTVKVRSQDTLTNRELRRAFAPHKVKRIYTDFPMKKIKDIPS